MTVERSAGETTVTYDPSTRKLTIACDSRALVSGAIRVAVGDDHVPGATPARITEDRDGVRVTHEGAIETTVALSASERGVDVTVAVTNDTAEPHELGDMELLAGGKMAYGPEDRMYEHGYQSWTATGTKPLSESFRDETEENIPQMLDTTAPLDARTSHFVTGFDGEPGPLTLGYLEHDRYISRFDVDTDDDNQLTAVCPGDGVTIEPGDTRQSAPLRVDATRSMPDALESIADEIGDRMNARIPDTTPTGWCSWYHYYTDVTADDIRDNATELDEWGVPVQLLQIDDGYETAFGDWTDLAEGFDDMPALCDDLSEDGYWPGIWLAPLYVQGDSQLVADHPEWMITQDGEPVNAGERHGPMYGLDTTHPGAQEWLTETFETVVEEWGFDYLKLDFLYAAALPGDRYRDVTRGEALRMGMETIREAVGDDVFVLGCGAPGFPCVGTIDSMRVGPDTHSEWSRPDVPQSEPAHANAVRNSLNRQFCHRRTWLTDPDCQLVRETTDLTRAERRAFATIVALCGGTNMISDKISEIDDWGRDLVERSLPPIDDCNVEGVGEQGTPDTMVCERAVDGAVAVAQFNFDDEPGTVTVDPDARVGGDARWWNAFDDEPIRTGSPVEFDLEAHDAALVHCAPARDRPHLVGSRHLSNAATQIESVEWAPTDSGGTLTVTVDAPHAMELVAAVPDDWERVAGDSTADPDTTRIHAEPGGTAVDFELAGDR